MVDVGNVWLGMERWWSLEVRVERISVKIVGSGFAVVGEVGEVEEVGELNETEGEDVAI